MAGKFANLWKLFGYFDAAPVNLTPKERTSMGLGPSLLDSMSWYQGQTSPSGDHSAHLDELQEMTKFEFIQPIVELYAEEATQPDTSKGKTVWYECNDSEIEKDLNKMLDRINNEDLVYPIAFDLAGFGNHIRRVLRNEEDGITQLVPCELKEIERIWEPTTRRLVGFNWKDNPPAPSEAVTVGNQPLFAPWEFVHFRRLGRSTKTEYGEALIEHLFPLYRKIKLAVDQMLIFRLNSMPNRFAVMIDVGTQSVSEAMETVNMFKNHFRSSLSIDGKSFEARHNPMALDSMMFFPKPKDSNTEVTTLQGTADVPDVPDLKLLFNMLFGAARVPKAYLGFEEDAGGLAKASLVTQDMRFARLTRVLRRPVVVGYHRLAQLQIAFRGKDPKNYQVKVHMSKICALEEEVKATMMEKQANMAQTIIGICQMLTIPNKDIVELVFREILHLPNNFINVAKLAMSVQQAVGMPQQDQGMGGPGGPGMGGAGDLGGDLGLGGPPGGSPLTNDPAAAGAGPMQTTAQAGVSNAQLSSSFGPTGPILMEAHDAMNAFERGLRTLTESTETRAKMKAVAWSLKTDLLEMFAMRATGKISLVENVVPEWGSEPLPGTVIRADSLSESTDAAAHPSVAIVRHHRGGAKRAITEVFTGSHISESANQHPAVQMTQRERSA